MKITADIVRLEYERERILGRISINESKLESKQMELCRIDRSLSNLEGVAQQVEELKGIRSRLLDEICGLSGVNTELNIQSINIHDKIASIKQNG